MLLMPFHTGGLVVSCSQPVTTGHDIDSVSQSLDIYLFKIRINRQEIDLRFSY